MYILAAPVPRQKNSINLKPHNPRDASASTEGARRFGRRPRRTADGRVATAAPDRRLSSPDRPASNRLCVGAGRRRRFDRRLLDERRLLLRMRPGLGLRRDDRRGNEPLLDVDCELVDLLQGIEGDVRGIACRLPPATIDCVATDVPGTRQPFERRLHDCRLEVIHLAGTEREDVAVEEATVVLPDIQNPTVDHPRDAIAAVLPSSAVDDEDLASPSQKKKTKKKEQTTKTFFSAW